ncbi:MAG: Conserved TM helix repeat-containing protein [Candidatus Roizmanbacteria bacterium GW2011_GWA2_35_8]|uniref:Conserved TM helix repeat-containing protein n=1 Tax=Candidatus Roizmanbacteria bacterium GW2011_GWA2_35_8 TaxID=1618479 RepID=A0A0G0G4X0_9BACT|nr:MAG: Conserved TM helix repeat-containing protein [Candidatus Roizmanbacteria bacterium GW2011_GWA2_35_8]
MLELVNSILVDFFQKLGGYLPSLFGGLIILIIGLLIGGIVKHVIMSILAFLKIENVFEKARLFKKQEVKIWEEVLVEILKWALIIVFLIPALEVWGLNQATQVLNQFLFYLPNVIVAVVIAFVGLLAANLAADLVRHSIRTVRSSSANGLAVFTKWSINFFTVLVVLNQLGVAQDLVRILFTGIVAMLSIAGGLAFGLGGRDTAQELLEELKRKLK